MLFFFNNSTFSYNDLHNLGLLANVEWDFNNTHPLILILLSSTSLRLTHFNFYIKHPTVGYEHHSNIKVSDEIA